MIKENISKTAKLLYENAPFMSVLQSLNVWTFCVKKRDEKSNKAKILVALNQLEDVAKEFDSR